MQLLERSGETYALVTLRPAQPALLAALPLGLLAIVPFLAPEPLTLWRVLSAAAIIAALLLLLLRARPQRRRALLKHTGNELRVGQQQHEVLGLALSGVREDWPSAAPAFRALLLTPQQPVVLLHGPDPALVLTQAVELAGWLKVSLQPGWGLGQEAFAAPPSGRQGGSSQVVVRSEVRPSQTAIGFTALGSTVFILVFVAMLMTARAQRGQPIMALSFVLPALTVAYGLVVTCLLLGASSSVEIGREAVTYALVLFGKPMRRQRVELDELIAAYAVTPGSGQPTHVLLRTRAGWVAFPFAGPRAGRVVTVLMDSTASANRPDQRVQATENAGFSSASAAGS
ncbi:MAG TPA: hypothetical protein VGP93_04355 [Polyangiaceae bacterium]|nr:hypothetical protein [Polyangiaceae bacterium]